MFSQSTNSFYSALLHWVFFSCYTAAHGHTAVWCQPGWLPSPAAASYSQTVWCPWRPSAGPQVSTRTTLFIFLSLYICVMVFYSPFHKMHARIYSTQCTITYHTFLPRERGLCPFWFLANMLEKQREANERRTVSSCVIGDNVDSLDVPQQ